MQAQGKQGESRGILARRGWWDLGGFLFQTLPEKTEQEGSAQCLHETAVIQAHTVFWTGQSFVCQFPGHHKGRNSDFLLPPCPCNCLPQKFHGRKTLSSKHWALS